MLIPAGVLLYYTQGGTHREAMLFPIFLPTKGYPLSLTLSSYSAVLRSFFTKDQLFWWRAPGLGWYIKYAAPVAGLDVCVDQ